MSGNTILRADSGHPRHTIRGNPVGQMLRIRLICSKEVHYQYEPEQMCQRFTQRGYSTADLSRALEIAGATPRGTCWVRGKRLEIVVHQYFPQIIAWNFTK